MLYDKLIEGFFDIDLDLCSAKNREVFYGNFEIIELVFCIK